MLSIAEMTNVSAVIGNFGTRAGRAARRFLTLDPQNNALFGLVYSLQLQQIGVGQGTPNNIHRLAHNFKIPNQPHRSCTESAPEPILVQRDTGSKRSFRLLPMGRPPPRRDSFIGVRPAARLLLRWDAVLLQNIRALLRHLSTLNRQLLLGFDISLVQGTRVLTYGVNQRGHITATLREMKQRFRLIFISSHHLQRGLS